VKPENRGRLAVHAAKRPSLRQGSRNRVSQARTVIETLLACAGGKLKLHREQQNVPELASRVHHPLPLLEGDESHN
jgi:hypothetical protein